VTGKKAVVTEPIAEDGLKMLREEAELIYLPDMPGKTLADVIGEASAIGVRVTRIDRALLEKAVNLIIIAKHGVGYDNIDVEAATQRKIVVVNTPVANAESVAEHDLGLMLSLAKKISASDRSLREGRLQRREDYIGTELKDRTLGLVGMGRIGATLARQCQAAFNMRPIGCDPYVPSERAEQLGIAKREKLDEVMREADFVAVCVPLNKETANLIGTKELGLMKPTAFLVNSSRGGIVDEGALYDILINRKIAGAALDVFVHEPPPSDHPLLSLDNFIATPHNAGMTAEAMKRMAITVAEEILRVFRGERPKYPLNPQVLS
jgi:D-3-phosphoglycerate dehydrogenase